MSLFSKTRKKSEDISDFLARKNAQMIDRVNNRGKDMEKDTMVWLCRAFAAIAFIIGVFYFVIFAMRISGR